MSIESKKRRYCKKYGYKDIPKSVGTASYADVSYVRHALEQLEIAKNLTGVDQYVFIEEYQRRGEIHLNNLKDKINESKIELVGLGVQNLDFGVVYAAIANQRACLKGLIVDGSVSAVGIDRQEESANNMLVAHRAMGEILLLSYNFRPVIPELDWIDDNGNQLGLIGR